MIYAVSDIHGCYDKYRELLKAISFGKNDILYVLGDVIDRGPDGFQILLDMAQRPNVINLIYFYAFNVIEGMDTLGGNTDSRGWLLEDLEPLGFEVCPFVRMSKGTSQAEIERTIQYKGAPTPTGA